MSFSVGIIGLPNTGKSTLFKALTKKQVDIADYPFTTIDPNVGVVAVPDERLEKITKVISPQKTTETVIGFVDIAGLVKGAHRGEGLGNQFLSHIRSCDAIVEIIRAFENPNIEHVEGDINPKRDSEVIRTELLMKDLETIEKAITKTKEEAKREKKASQKLEVLEKVKQALSNNKLITGLNLTDKEKTEIKEYQLLTAKPKLCLLNIGKEKPTDKDLELKNLFPSSLLINLKIEQEASELSQEELKELDITSQLGQLILACYNILNLITFFTVAGKKETRAWTLKKGSNAILAASKVHSDFAEKFVRAEVIPWQELAKTESWTKAKELGLIKTVGKEYQVQDGDVIEFKT